jgi:hypothetical protein
MNATSAKPRDTKISAYASITTELPVFALAKKIARKVPIRSTIVNVSRQSGPFAGAFTNVNVFGVDHAKQSSEARTEDAPTTVANGAATKGNEVLRPSVSVQIMCQRAIAPLGDISIAKFIDRFTHNAIEF